MDLHHTPLFPKERVQGLGEKKFGKGYQDVDVFKSVQISHKMLSKFMFVVYCLSI